jgi:hypothetical protein
MQKFPEPELLAGIQEFLQHLSDWLLNKTSREVEVRYRAFGARLASEGVALADCCWAVIITKQYFGTFCRNKAFSVAPLNCTAKWNCYACSTSSLIMRSAIA